MNQKNNFLVHLNIEISHVFKYKGYTKKQRFEMWFLYMLRHILEIISGIVGIITLGVIQTWWPLSISERVLKNQMKFFKENKENKNGRNGFCNFR